MQAIACLMNADIQVLMSAGREEGGIQLMSTTLEYNPQLLLQALAIEATYSTLDPLIQADLSDEEWNAALEMPPLILASGGAEADSVIYILGCLLLKNVGGNARYMSEGFSSLRTALIRQNPGLMTGLGRKTAEESFLLPMRETCILVQEGAGKYPEYSEPSYQSLSDVRRSNSRLRTPVGVRLRRRKGPRIKYNRPWISRQFTYSR